MSVNSRESSLRRENSRQQRKPLRHRQPRPGPTGQNVLAVPTNQMNKIEHHLGQRVKDTDDEQV